jgi:predicted NBD/HSP70 family sugar kinase
MKAQQPTRLARYNRSAILNLIRRFGPVSQAELAQRSGLASSSVVNITRSLLRRGLVRAVGTGPSTGGRPPTLLELNPEAGYAIGVNIRFVEVECVLVDLVGDIVADTSLPPEGEDTASVVRTVREAVEQVMRLGSVDPGRVLGVGVGCPGVVRDGRTLVGTPEFPGWQEQPLADVLERALGLPVVLENNANLAALAEYRHGIGREGTVPDSLVYIYADHGIGSGLMIDGQLWRGSDGLAGEFGHTVIDVNGPPCVCGSHGCLEALASIRAILRRVTTATRLQGLPDEHLNFPVVREAIEAGDPVATSAADEAMGYLAVGVANLDRQIRPDVIVVGGELFSPGSDMFDRLLAILDRRPKLYGASTSRLLAGALGTRAPSVGAGTVVLESFFGVPEREIASESESDALEPTFESAPLWPVHTDAAMEGWTSTATVAWAGNLQPSVARLRGGDAVTVTVQARVVGDTDGHGVKTLLHWDRVPLFGGSWPSPKNSPMHVVSTTDDITTYGVTLGSLPVGKYEFTVHLLAANDVWVPGARQPNGRIEVLPARARAEKLVEAEERTEGDTLAHGLGGRRVRGSDRD